MPSMVCGSTAAQHRAALPPTEGISTNTRVKNTSPRHKPATTNKITVQRGNKTNEHRKTESTKLKIRTRLPPNLRPISQDKSQRITAEHQWHLRMNHTTLNTLSIVGYKSEIELPGLLRHGSTIMSCSRYSEEHTQRESQKSITALPSLGHIVAAHIAGHPIPDNSPSKSENGDSRQASHIAYGHCAPLWAAPITTPSVQ